METNTEDTGVSQEQMMFDEALDEFFNTLLDKVEKKEISCNKAKKFFKKKHTGTTISELP